MSDDIYHADPALLQTARDLYKTLKANGWCKQGHLTRLGFSGSTVRKICNEFAPHFISNTRDGYNVLVNVDAEFIEQSIADLRSRIQKMERRAGLLEKALEERVTRQSKLL